jgi:coproporphyrinogen III oxidase-like Fe-S oxidoreductase
MGYFETMFDFHPFINTVARWKIQRSVQFEGGPPPAMPMGAAVGGPSRLLYIHIPFCEKLCPYCSFNRVPFDAALCHDYWRALRREIDLYRSRGYDFGGVYFGGGTPTILVEELEETVAHLRRSFSVREISVETNPNHLEPRRLESLRRCGVKRLSIGIQSFDDGLLKAMERYEKYGSGREILMRLKSARGLFETVNADMIFNFPSQSPEALDRDLDVLLESGVDQITYYPLMVSDSTRKLVEKNLGKVDYAREQTYYRQIVERLLPHYRFSSVWCFSRQASMIDEYIVNYDEYAGLGSGSFGYLDGTCYANTFRIDEYISRIGRGELPVMASKNFAVADRILYDLLMALFGLNLDFSRFRTIYGRKAWFHLSYPLLALFLGGGIGYAKGRFHVTDRGRYYALIMMREFFIAVNNFRDYCRQ